MAKSLKTLNMFHVHVRCVLNISCKDKIFNKVVFGKDNNDVSTSQTSIDSTASCTLVETHLDDQTCFKYMCKRELKTMLNTLYIWLQGFTELVCGSEEILTIGRRQIHSQKVQYPHTYQPVSCFRDTTNYQYHSCVGLYI